MRRVGKQRARLSDGAGASGIGEEPVVSDAVKAVGQDVKEEAADELVCIERHNAVTGPSVAPVIFPFEADTLAIEGDEAGIGDGDTMGVAGEIGEHLIWAGEGTLGIDKPCDRKSSGEEDEHDVLKPFIAIQRVQLPPGKG
jgi:hypothetical protein